MIVAPEELWACFVSVGVVLVCMQANTDQIKLTTYTNFIGI